MRPYNYKGFKIFGISLGGIQVLQKSNYIGCMYMIRLWEGVCTVHMVGLCINVYFESYVIVD